MALPATDTGPIAAPRRRMGRHTIIGRGSSVDPPPVTDMLVAAVVVLTGLHLVGVAAVAFAAPALASRFLLGLASSAPAHYVELGVRFIVGGAFLAHAPHMAMPAVFTTVGWVLVITTAVLLVMPWRWHRRFAERFVPPVVQHLRLLGVASFVLGGCILAASM